MGQIDRKTDIIMQGCFFTWVVGCLTIAGGAIYGVVKLVQWML